MTAHVGEGNIFRNLYLMSATIAVAFTLMVIGSLVWNIHHEYLNQVAQARKEALATFNKDLSLRSWATKHGGVYVPATKETPPNIYLSHVPERDIVTPSGKRLTLMNPAYMLRQTMQEYEDVYGVKGHITSLNLLSPANLPDPWERKSLEAFAAGATEVAEIAEIGGKPYLRFMQPVITKEGCLKCHAQQGYKSGDVRGGVGVAVPMAPYLAAEKSASRVMVVSHLFVWLLGMTGIGLGFFRTRTGIFERLLVEESLCKSEERYRSLIQKVQAAIILHDTRGSVLDSNTLAQELLGLSAEQLLGMTVTDPQWHFLREDGTVMPLEEYPASQVLTTRQPLRNQVTGIRSPNRGDVVWVLVNAEPEYEDTDKIALVIVSFVDITERKRAEESLLQSEARLNEAQRISHLGNWELDLVSNALIWSDEIYRIFEIDREQFGASYDAFLAAIHPDDRELVSRSYSESVATHTPYDIVHRLLMKDGRIKYVNERCNTYYGEDGRPLRSVGMVHDITDRKRIEETLLHLAGIVKFSDDAIIGKSPQGIILSWNRGAERLYGYQEEEVQGRSISMLIPEERAGEMAGFLDQTNRGIPIEHYETVRLRKDGSRVDVSVTVSPIRDTAGRIVGASTIARDITERKKAEADLRKLYEQLEQRVSERTADLNRRSEELAQSQRALMNIVEDLHLKTEELEQVNTKLQDLDRLKSMFIASMSHELRTPLNSIIGFSSILHDEWLGSVNKDQKENLAIILRSGKHLLSLINDVIDVSKIEAGKIESIAEEFDLNELISEAVNLVKKDLDDKGLSLQVTAPHQQMYMDRRRLLQCVLNLLSNAIKFTQQGGVTVEALIVPGAGVAEISVTDTGIGIRQEDLPKMFQPFVRLVSPLQAVVPGTGLGLYLTRKLAADVLDGDMLLTSEYGKGSRFTIKLPVRKP